MHGLPAGLEQLQGLLAVACLTSLVLLTVWLYRREGRAGAAHAAADAGATGGTKTKKKRSVVPG